VSGVTIKEMRDEEAQEVPDALSVMRPSEYVLLSAEEDRDAAHRWHCEYDSKASRIGA
jgi:hypothetical protein